MHTEVVKKDSTFLSVSREDLIYSIIEKLDFTTTKITFYNPPDSSGKQTVNVVIEKENKIKTTTTTSAEENENKVIKTGSNEASKQETSLDQHQTTTEQKNKTPLKIYLYIIAISGVLLFFALRWIRKKFF
jgi:hypothetical protein